MNKGLIILSDLAYRGMYSEIWGMMQFFRPTHIEFKAWEGYWYLYGESHLFDELKEGEDTPTYTVQSKAGDNGQPEFRFVRNK